MGGLEVARRHTPMRPHTASGGSTPHVRTLGVRELWRSLPLSCRLFLGCSALEAVLATAFAGAAYSQVPWAGARSNPPPSLLSYALTAWASVSQAGQRQLQDLLLVDASSAYFLFMVASAFLTQNAPQLLACTALGVLNCSQLVVYGVGEGAGSAGHCSVEGGVEDRGPAPLS